VEQGNPYAVTVDYSGVNPNTLANPFPALPALGSFAQRYANPVPACMVGAADVSAACDAELSLPFIQPHQHTPLARQYNFQIQYNFAPSWVLEVGYVGESAINLVDAYHNYNQAQLASPSNPINGVTTNTLENIQFRVPYLGYQPVGLSGTGYDLISNYNSLQITARHSFSRGFLVSAAYTWSKALTDENGQVANGNQATNLAQQYGPAYFNRPQRFVINYSWDLPFGKHTGAMDKLLGGWNLSGVTTVQDGNLFTVIDSAGGTIYGTSTTSLTQGYSRAQLCPGVTYSSMYSSGGIESRLGGNSGGPGWFAANSFCTPPKIGDGYDYGNMGPGTAQGPGEFNFDVTLMKNTRIGEKQNIQFRAEFFNLFNHSQFNAPGTVLGVGNPTLPLPDVNSAVFGRVTSMAVNPRVIQLGLKYIF
jgi:hypothetical protein